MTNARERSEQASPNPVAVYAPKRMMRLCASLFVVNVRKVSKKHCTIKVHVIACLNVARAARNIAH